MIYKKVGEYVENIIKLYTIKMVPIRKIAKMYGCDMGTIRYWLQKNKVRSIERWERTDGSITQRQREIIIGGILGDSHMPKLRPNQKNHRVTFAQSEKQIEYLKWKKQEMGNFSKKIIRKNSGGYIQYSFDTVSHPYFNEIYDLFYKDGVKVFPDIEITPLILSVWIMDDGCCYKNKVRLATNSFTLEENKIISQKIKDTFNIKTTLSLHKKSGTYCLLFSMRDNFILKPIIEPHIIESMKYKLPNPFIARYKPSLTYKRQQSIIRSI